MLSRWCLLISLASALFLAACSGEDRSTSPLLTCQGCSVTELAAGDELVLDASWLGTAWDSGPMPTEGRRNVCDPFRVELACGDASCETTRKSPNGRFWSLEQAAAAEPGDDDRGTSCLIGPEEFAVRPTSGGTLSLHVVLVNLRTEEQASYDFGPMPVSAPTIAPRAECEGCNEYGRVGVGVPFHVRARWDGEAGGDDPIGRQPFVLKLDCGGVACEAQPAGWFDPGQDMYHSLEPIPVDAGSAIHGADLVVRATTPGTMALSAQLEHGVTHETVSFDFGSTAQLEVDALEVLCLGGQLCDPSEQFLPGAIFGVLGLAGETEVFVDANVRYASDVTPAPQGTDCSPTAYLAGDGTEIAACETRLYAVDGITEFTLIADWNGLSAHRSAPEP